MVVTPEWVGVVLTAMAMSGGIGVWLERRLAQGRAALPIVRARWANHDRVRLVRITLVNRLDEDLLITEIRASGPLIEQSIDYDVGGSITDVALIPGEPVKALDWRIGAKEAGWEEFRFDDPSPSAWAKITISSSSRTLRSRRVTVRPNQNP